jgi:hypothetical protein
MKAAIKNYGVQKYGDRYSWTPLTHQEIVDFLESRRLKTDISKKDLSLSANYCYTAYCNLVNGNHKFTKKSFAAFYKAILNAKTVVESEPKQLEIPMDEMPEKIEEPTKVEKPIYGVMSIEQMITKIKAAGYKVMRRTEGWEEI